MGSEEGAEKAQGPPAAHTEADTKPWVLASQSVQAAELAWWPHSHKGHLAAP